MKNFLNFEDYVASLNEAVKGDGIEIEFYDILLMYDQLKAGEAAVVKDPKLLKQVIDDGLATYDEERKWFFKTPEGYAQLAADAKLAHDAYLKELKSHKVEVKGRPKVYDDADGLIYKLLIEYDSPAFLWFVEFYLNSPINGTGRLLPVDPSVVKKMSDMGKVHCNYRRAMVGPEIKKLGGKERIWRNDLIEIIMEKVPNYEKLIKR